MPTISLTLPVSATVITAGLHSTNYTTIQNLVNGGLDTANWASGKIFAPSKLMQEGATIGQGTLWNGTQWVPNDTDRVYDTVTAAVDVNTSVAETTIYTKSITGGDLGSTKMCRLTLIGDYLHNNVAGDTVTVRGKFGGTTLFQQTTSLGAATGAARQTWRMQFEVENLGATNSQLGSGTLVFPPTGGGAATTLMDFGPASADTTAAQTLLVSAQWSASSANDSWRMRYAKLEVL